MISDDFVKKFTQGAADAEGFFNGDPNSVPKRANNPCDLTDENHRQDPEQGIGLGTIRTGGPNGALITIYANVDDGWNAGYRKFRRMLSGASTVYTLDMTLTDVGLKYSGTREWGDNLAKFLGVSPDTTLATLAALNQVAAADADKGWPNA
jgi:hypothetical protein